MRLFFRRNLGRVVQAVLASSLPAACGTGETIDVDAGDASKAADARDAREEGPCNCFDCPVPDKVMTTTYKECGDAQANDADGDAAPTCFVDCNTPCDTAFGDAAAECNGDWMNPQSPIACQCIDLSEDDAGSVSVQCIIGFVCGRRHAGLVDANVDVSTLGRTFAMCAWLEAASIRSFRTLARELAAYGAPPRLVRSARAAARDETRHARWMAQLAHAYGARIPRVETDEVPSRSLEALAIENAVEGCVGETYGALVAAWQAEHARPDVSVVLQRIARDELAHAKLAWRVAGWAEPHLDSLARRRVSASRRAAVKRLLFVARTEPPADAVTVAGVPNARQAQHLVRALFALDA